MIIDDRLAIDAGSLAFSCSELQREEVRDIVLTHTHLDHIAGLPMFVDDLFASLKRPLRVHATREMIDTLERDVFNWRIYPRFSELANSHGSVLEYHEFAIGDTIDVAGLKLRSVEVNHKVQASGYLISDGGTCIAITGDTAPTDAFWEACNSTPGLQAVFVECAFPDELAHLANVSYHLTPTGLAGELEKLKAPNTAVYVINLKPMYRNRIVEEIRSAGLDRLEILEIGKVYEF